ncbi:GNAT family N-acetyltransferase [Agromyces soli]|uniref:GNAT family N-acetyltransferase n=1 Tax=Agromyces soli TaxID=659012 RepID=A0ABY4AP79_9MICO|nr:GNAT family N-acetyltransferase [Agromyces soli]UOE24939.1 GNAT family N-acetyltransferase [Agromyces soli]
MDDRAALLLAYDDELRTDAEVREAEAVERFGPLLVARFAGGRGFVSYRDLGDATAERVGELVTEVARRFADDERIVEAEWKTRGHDAAPGLHEALLGHGFVPEEPESIMVGEASSLAVDVELPPGVVVRRVVEEHEVRAASAMQDEVFGAPVSEVRADELLRKLARGDGVEEWVAEVDGRFISAGRIEPVPGTRFAGIWGGATREEWRGRGVYRALTSARARSALAQGKTLINSDSTEFSRPILERSGLVKVSTTTPYVWQR